MTLLGSPPGCYDLRPFPPAELAHLNGYDIHNEAMVAVRSGRYTSLSTVTDRPYRVLDYQGEPMDFSSRTRLYLDITDVGRRGGRFNSIEVNEEMLRGQAINETTHSIEQIIVPISQVRRSELRVSNNNKTLALLLGLTLGSTAVITALTLGLTFGLSKR